MPTPLNEDVHILHRVIEALYASATGIDSWDVFLRELYESFPGTKVALISNQIAENSDCRVLHHGYDGALAEEYSNYYHTINPWNPIVANLDLLAPATSDTELPSSSFSNSEFYTDFIERVGEIESAVGVKIFDDSRTYSFLNLHYGTRSSGYYNELLPSFIQLLAPHLQNAIAISSAKNVGSSPLTTISGLVHQFTEAAFLLDPRGAVIEMNDRGQALVDHGSIVSLESGDRLHVLDVNSSALLRRRLQSSTVTPVRLTRHGRPPGIAWKFLEFLYAPVESRLGWLPPGGKWIIALFDASYATDLAAHTGSRFGLTHQESNVARALMRGLTARETGTALGISYHTVRQHLKAIFAKTSTSRQAQLVATLAGTLDSIEEGDDSE